jgi:hypothetical protein
MFHFETKKSSEMMRKKNIFKRKEKLDATLSPFFKLKKCVFLFCFEGKITKVKAKQKI